MRTIRFRGQFVYSNTQTGKLDWVYGDLVHYPEHIGKHKIVCEGGVQFEVLASTIGQFTGLHDKNGNEIYEGDIVKRKCVNDGWPTNEGNWPVVFKNGSFGIEVGDGTHIRFAEKEVWADMSASGENIYEYEIIGNIYDNPELLKED